MDDRKKKVFGFFCWPPAAQVANRSWNDVSLFSYCIIVIIIHAWSNLLLLCSLFSVIFIQ